MINQYNSFLTNNTMDNIFQVPSRYQDIDYTNNDFIPSDATQIILPQNLKRIGMGAFYDLKNLSQITIPDSVEHIDYNPFCNCENLEAFYGKYASEDNRCLIKDGVLISFAQKGLTEYTIPNGVTSICKFAFQECSSLQKIIIPNGVTNIECRAFTKCKNLLQIELPDSIIEIGEGAFFNCENLQSIIIPKGVKTIKEETFAFCKNLSEVVIPDTILAIENLAFFDCVKLKNYHIPESVQFIDESAFGDSNYKPSTNSDAMSFNELQSLLSSLTR